MSSGEVVVARGRLTNARTGDFVEFLFNPEEINDDKGTHLLIQTLPGQGEPLVRWLAGKERTISFKLLIDGAESLRRRGVNLLNGAIPEEYGVERATNTYSIAAELEFFRQFLYPVDLSETPEADADQAVFTFGRMYPAVRCYVAEAPIRITQFSVDLDPVRAEISLKLTKVANRQVYSNEIFRRYST